MSSFRKLDRRRLPASDFAIPESRSFPIPDRKHARMALDDANGERDASKRERVRRAVAERFPELAQDAAQDHWRESGRRDRANASHDERRERGVLPIRLTPDRGLKPRADGGHHRDDDRSAALKRSDRSNSRRRK